MNRCRFFVRMMFIAAVILSGQLTASAKMAKNAWQDLGTYQIWNWADDSQSGPGGDWAWGGDINWYWFSWNQSSGDNLQAVGRSYANYGASPGYGGKWIDSLPATFVCYANGAPNNVNGDYCFGIYGWFTPAAYSSSRGAGAYEIYISLAYSASEGPGPDNRYLGNVVTNGVTFRCYERPVTWSNFRQFRAYAVNQSWSGGINITPIIKKWRANGMANAVLDELNWMTESYGAGSGDVVLTGISIPTP